MVFLAVDVERFRSVVQFLLWCIEYALFFVVDGDGVEDDFAEGVAVAVFDDAHV